mmetsp:Transcript_21581/g.54890  ORF Transcript_21581/g.54890 Transcript_21581/m.54890 type:complete len:274 (+) Transcript_21581:74-895(+)
MVAAEPRPPSPFVLPPSPPLQRWPPRPPPHAAPALQPWLADLGGGSGYKSHSLPRPVCSFSDARLHACAERIRIYVEALVLLLLLAPLLYLLRLAWSRGRQHGACRSGGATKRGKLREGREQMTLLAKRARRALRRAPPRKRNSLSSIAEGDEEDGDGDEEEHFVGLEEAGEEEAERDAEGEAEREAVATSVDQPSPQDQPDGRFPQGSPPSRRLASGASVLCSPEPLAPATSAAGFLPEASAPFRGSSPGGMPFPSTLPSTPQTTLCTLTAG